MLLFLDYMAPYRIQDHYQDYMQLSHKLTDFEKFPLLLPFHTHLQSYHLIIDKIKMQYKQFRKLDHY